MISFKAFRTTLDEGVDSAAKKPENFVAPDGKTHTRMVPAKKDVIKKDADQHTEDADPCWDSHKQVGMKKKGGKMVPNCVPKESVELDEEVDESYKDMSQDERDKFAQSVGDRFRAKQRSDKVSSMSRKRATKVKEDTVSESHVIHKNGKPMSIKGKPVTATSQDHANKIINKLKAHPFNKDHKFTVVAIDAQKAKSAPSKSRPAPTRSTGRRYDSRFANSQVAAWRYAERGE